MSAPARVKGCSRLRRLAHAVQSGLLGGRVARWSYRCGLHGRLWVTRHEVRLSSEAPLPVPLVPAFASDFHAGPSTDPRIFAHLVEELMRLQPHVLLLGGNRVVPGGACGRAACHSGALCTALGRVRSAG